VLVAQHDRAFLLAFIGAGLIDRGNLPQRCVLSGGDVARCPALTRDRGRASVLYFEGPWGNDMSSAADAEDEDAPLAATILLVDDRPANLLALEAVLGPLGHKLVLAHSGEEALRQILKQEFALILMDVQMPDLDGYQTVALIKKRQVSKDIPIIFVSAVAKDAAQISRGYAYGAVDYMTKPFDPDILRAKVSVLVALYLQAERIVRQRNLLQEQRRRAESDRTARDAAETANRVKDEFLAMVSHELRGPLNAILGWANMLQAGGLDPDRTRHALATIERNAHAQTQLIEDLLDVSRIVRGKLRLHVQPIRLTTVLDAAIDVVRPAADAKGVELATFVDREADVGTGDPDRLQQVFWNLLSNAVKFTQSGGRVEIRLRRTNAAFEITVSDTGRGIAAEDLNHVFDRFWQSAQGAPSRRGLGLGLAIVRHLVELHGGEVHAESDGAGRGATFSVTLPIRAVQVEEPKETAEPPSRPERRAAPDMTSLAGLHVLVVDDDADARELVSSLLAKYGAEPVAVGSAADALDAIARQSIDLVLSDVGMPQRDGLSLMQDLRRIGLHVPAIALSAYTHEADVRRALQAGFDLHLGKPVDATRLVSAVSDLARRAPSVQAR
jgi:signal transduction histidine kinase/BarA-like signal transduction histidine kinase